MALSGTTGGSIKVEGLRETIKQLEALGATKQEFVEINQMLCAEKEVGYVANYLSKPEFFSQEDWEEYSFADHERLFIHKIERNDEIIKNIGTLDRMQSIRTLVFLKNVLKTNKFR